jgi:uncharacterized protein
MLTHFLMLLELRSISGYVPPAQREFPAVITGWKRFLPPGMLGSGMPTIVHVDIPAEQIQRAKKFYETLFGWKFNAAPGFPDYSLFETTDESGASALRGGLGQRGSPDQRITCYIGVDSIADYLPKIEQMGGKVTMPYTEIPGFGALALCMDTENNPFGLWEERKEY